jgi:hypothetical protein
MSAAALQPLHAYLQAWPGFDWRDRHCVAFAMGYAAPDMPPVEPLSGPRSVRPALRARGVATLSAFVGKYLRPVSPMLAQPGDVVQVRRTLGLCDGRVAWLPMNDALVAVPMAQVLHAWKRAAP